MVRTNSIKPPRWYWIATAVVVLFVAFGVFTLVTSFFNIDKDAIELYGFRPGWTYWLFFDVAIGAEVVGALCLLCRRVWAVPAFGASVFFSILLYTYLYVNATVPGAIVGPVVITGLHAGLLWFAIYCKRRGWLSRVA